MPIVVIAMACIGLAGIIAGIVATRVNWHVARTEDASQSSRRWLVACLVLGALLGAASWPLTYWMGYPVQFDAEVGRVVGVPFFVAYFDSDGRDYVGPLTLLGVIANAVFWLLMPQLVLYAVKRYRKAKNGPATV